MFEPKYMHVRRGRNSEQCGHTSPSPCGRKAAVRQLNVPERDCHVVGWKYVDASPPDFPGTTILEEAAEHSTARSAAKLPTVPP